METRPTAPGTSEVQSKVSAPPPTTYSATGAGGGLESLPPLAVSDEAARLEQARAKYEQGRFPEAEEILKGLQLSFKQNLSAVPPEAISGLPVPPNIAPSPSSISGGPAIVSAAVIYASACSLLGRINWGRAERDEAQAALNEAAAFFSRGLPEPSQQTARYYSDYGVTLQILGRSTEAIPYLKNAMANGFHTVETSYFLGVALQAQGPEHYSEAVEQFQHVLEHSPNDFRAQAGLAAIFEAQGQTSDAARAYQRAAWSASVLGRTVESLALAERAFQIQPTIQAAGVKGLALYMAERYQEALNVIEEAMRGSAERNASALAVMGASLVALGRPAEALAPLDEALQLVPNLSWALQMKGAALVNLGRYEEALIPLEQAIALAPDNIWPLEMKGNSLTALGRYQEALDLVNRLLTLKPDGVNYREVKAWLLRNLGHNDEALRVLDEILSDNPKSVLALAYKGQTLRSLGNLPTALESYQQTLQLAAANPAFNWVRIEAADILHQLGRHDEALRTVDEALSVEPKNAQALAIKGQVLIALDRPSEAVGLLQEAVKLQPALEWAQMALAEACRRTKRFDEALAVLDEVLKSKPDHALALRLKGQTLSEQGRNAEAQEALNHALSRAPDDPLTLGNLGKVLRLLGKFEESVKLLERSVELDSQQAWTQTEYAESLRLLGRYPDALAALDRALTLRPQNARALLVKGQTLRALDRTTEAIEAFQQSVNLEKSGETYAALGEALFVLGRYPQATEAFKHSVESGPAVSTLISLAEAYRAQDLYKEAFAAVEQAEKVTAGAPVIAASKALLLSDVGEFQSAVDLLEKITVTGPGDAWVLGAKAWALEGLPGRAEPAKKAYEEAARFLPDDPWLQVGIANCMRRLRDPGAKEKYQAVVNQLKSIERSDPYVFYLLGWCHFGLERYDEAVRFLQSSASLEQIRVSAQFDIALSLLCGGRYGIAVSEYHRGVDLARDRNPLRRRGLLHVARKDLRETVDLKPDLSSVREVGEILALLESAFQEAQSAAQSAS